MKVLLFDFGSVLRVKTKERPEIILRLRDNLISKMKELNLDLEVEKIPTKEKAFRNFIRPKDWKKTVGKGLLSREEGWFKGFKNLGFDLEDESSKNFIRDLTRSLDFDGKVVLPGMRKLLEEMKKREEDVILAILSNHSLELFGWLENHYDLVPTLFAKENVLVSSKILCKKPSVEAYQAVFDLLSDTVISGFDQKNDEHKASILFIDNKKENCDAAEALGMRVYHYLHDIEHPDKSFGILREKILNHVQ